MRQWDVIVDLPAQQDIAECRLWIAERNVEAADRWFYGLLDTIATLEILPGRCPLAPESKFLNHEIRELLYGRRQNKYRILFTITESEVHVVHVRHGSRLALGEAELAEE